ncbi:hypothetical protein EVG20_g10731 [Dentipellis fragilis]|uniref:Uncharacterized protein n=1 Tax=Dentipellis fragilis TaxID=205917 RepID=A0A4Y9XS78_9AGAM|nr:hypothetical protein EVG20_g10731 [Dentipellis fragilis]
MGGNSTKALSGINGAEHLKKSARDLARDDLPQSPWRYPFPLHDEHPAELMTIRTLIPPQVVIYTQIEHLEDVTVSKPECINISKKAHLVRGASGFLTGVEYNYKYKARPSPLPGRRPHDGRAADFSADSLLKK